jgi:hypothetical protein
MAAEYKASIGQNKPLDPNNQKTFWSVFCGKVTSYNLKNVTTGNRR